MIRSKWFHQLLRILITMLGAGIGAGIVLMVLQLCAMADITPDIPLGTLAAVYVGAALLFGIVFLLLSSRLIDTVASLMEHITRRTETMNGSQLFACAVWLIIGLCIAALLSQILHFVGSSLFSAISSILLYVVFGALGLSIGIRRGSDSIPFRRIKRHRFTKQKRYHRSHSTGLCLLDTSAVIDGRFFAAAAMLPVSELLLPDIVLDELQQMAGSPDAGKRSSGCRGLEQLEKARETSKTTPVVIHCHVLPGQDFKTAVITTAKAHKATMITVDHELARLAVLNGVRAINLNELALLLRPAIHTGDEMQVVIQKEGREAGQGIAYAPDGNMIVVENAREHIGKTVTIIVTKVLESNAGRMIFARLKA